MSTRVSFATMMKLKQHSKFLILFIMTLWFGILPSVVQAADPAGTGADWNQTYLGLWGFSLFGALTALFFAFRFFKQVMGADPGNERMIEIAGYVRDGANTYLTQQFRIVIFFFAVIFVLLSIAAYVLKVQSTWVPFAFVTGGLFSGLAGWFGMKTATWASSRTAAAAQKSLNQGLQVAFRAGAVMGLVVVGLGLLDICAWFFVLYWMLPELKQESLPLMEITVTMLCFGMGASCQALFARVGGGIFTKAADVGADLVGKVEKNIPEDDPRNPAAIADNVGDNVGDVAGMGADLYESYCGSILATAALGVAAFSSPAVVEATGRETIDAQMHAVFLPMVIASVGIFLSIIGIFVIKTDEDATQASLLKALSRGIYLSTALVAAVGSVIIYFMMPGYFGLAASVIVGIVSGLIIGQWTEYSTSDHFKPTQDIAEQAITGPATVIIAGIAEGMSSAWVPVLTIGTATLTAFGFANGWNYIDVNFFALGLYGVGLAAVGMLSTLGITLATDAYGPIADNAGGNAEMAGLEPVVRQRTDALDSLGNTTAATGKGFAIGSAALTALALLAAYIEEVRVGFERWGDDTALVAELEPGFYKASHQFLIEKTDDPDAKTAKWLLLPQEATNKSWRNINFSLSSLTKVDDELFESHEHDGHDVLVFKETEGKLLSLHTATLPDFMRFYDATVMNPKVLVGIFLGAVSTFIFCAMTMKAVGRAAKGMVEEVRRQFKENPGIMDNTVKPDYEKPVDISTKAAQREMVAPSLLGLLTPVVVGFVLGVAGVLGLLVGALTTGFCVAIFMANAGGAWDNAKKYIEAGALGGKGTDAHKASVVGDTVGDPFKDTSGPSLNILIKLMSMVSVVVAGLAVRYSLLSLGIF